MNRPAALILPIAAAVFAITAGGCGGGDGDDETPTAGAVSSVEAGGSPGGAPSTAAETGPSITPEPSATAAPTEPAATNTPAVTELTFDMPDSGDGTKTAGSYGPLGIVYADSTFGVIPGQNRALAVAWVNIGINERPSATAWLSNNFRVPGEGTTPVTAQISTGVHWQGILAGNGAGGTRAAVRITLSVLDAEDRVIATEEVHALEHRESVLTVGGFDDISRTDVDMQVALTPGVYELRLTVMCEAGSGLIGVATHCVYGPSDTYDDGFVAWEPRTILFVP